MVLSSPLYPTPGNKLERPQKPKPINPIDAAIRSWLESLPVELLESINLTADSLLSSAPKRWVVYAPMVLLPSGSFGEEWGRILHLSNLSSHKSELWKLILEGIGKREGKGILTHLAINSGIPLIKDLNSDLGNINLEAKSENILRTPSGLIMLYGDFGPSLSLDAQPSTRDFEDAFWVRTKQNGITQIWAPRYTMFSRGNVKEKARLLDFHSSDQFESRKINQNGLENHIAVDLYAGIGYFVFSYVKMGIRRVIGWELNPWSVEGLRRGAVANGWSVRVVGPLDEAEVGDEKIVVFLEDNRKAGDTLKGLDRRTLGEVKHVNGGLLPRSDMSWEMALEILGGDGWLHLHENVGVNDVPARKVEIEDTFRGWLKTARVQREVKVEHVEFVKTFAPGVWHCVFDLYISNPGVQT